MDVEEVVKSGSLYVPPQGFLKQKKSWNKKYYILYTSSRQGIQRLEVFDTEDQYLKQHNCLRIIPLTNCLKVSPSPQKQQSNVFEIRTKESTYLFSTDSFNEMTEWLNCLQMVAFGANPMHNNTIPSVDSNANQFINKTNALNTLSEFQSEDNLLYCSVDTPDVYRVKLLDSETSIRCGLRSGCEYNYSLIVTSVHISLAEDGKVVFTWPYRHIRRYGCTKDGFSLEAGRKCASGDGLFSFITNDGNSIFQSVATHVNSLKTSQPFNDDQILGAINITPKLLPKEMAFHSNQSFNSKESKPPSLPSTSPPLSISYTSKSTYLATNSSLLPSTKIPDISKRHSIQPPKSPQMIPKQPLSRVTSVSNTNTIICSSDPKPRSSPPISKPPRKSKESKNSDSEEPLFVSREEMLGLKNNLDFHTNYKQNNEEVLYDEPGDMTTHSIESSEVQQTKSPFCPSPPPVNHTVSKLTSVLKSMFGTNSQNQIHLKNKDSKRLSSRSSTGSSYKSSNMSTPVTNASLEKDDSDEFTYAQVLDIDRSDKNNTKSHVKSNNDYNHYSKILNDRTDGTESRSRAQDYSERQYMNVRHEDIDECNDLNKRNSKHNNCQTEHYVQNECEYARVVKRTINNTTVL